MTTKSASAGIARSAFRVLTGLVAAVAAAGVVLGAWMVLEDMASHTDEFDGLGVVIGAMVLVAALVGGAMAVTALALVGRRPLVARVLGVLLALAGLALVYPLGVDTAWGWWLLPLPLALLVLAVFPEQTGR